MEYWKQVSFDTFLSVDLRVGSFERVDLGTKLRADCVGDEESDESEYDDTSDDRYQYDPPVVARARVDIEDYVEGGASGCKIGSGGGGGLEFVTIFLWARCLDEATWFACDGTSRLDDRLRSSSTLRNGIEFLVAQTREIGGNGRVERRASSHVHSRQFRS